MLPVLSRRQFLGTSLLGASATLLCLPSRLFADENGDEVVLRAAIMSDVHCQTARLERALRFMYDYSTEQKYQKFDALVVAGDMTNNGTLEQLMPFQDTLNRCLKPETTRVLCMGNHEFYGGNRDLWTKTLQADLLGKYNVNGFTFLTVAPENGSCNKGDYDYAIPWLRQQLEETAKRDADPHKPIFVIQHYHILNTVYGSCLPDWWGTIDLHETLCKFPQVIDFSGHSHYPIRDPRSAWQGEYSAFGTSTLSYHEMEGEPYVKFPAGYREAAEFYVMEVHRDNSVVLKPYDLRTNKFFDVVYLVAQPGNVEKYLYTDQRYETASAPKWKPGTEINLSVNPYLAQLSFPQAEDRENTVHSYTITIEKKDKESGNWQPFDTRYVWSEYYFCDMPEVLNVSVSGLQPETTYRIAVKPRNCFKKEGEELRIPEFTTPQDPDVTEDRNAPCPKANVLDIHFTETGPVNTPVNRRATQKTVEIIGAPKFVADATLAGTIVAQFNGKKDFLKIPFTEEEYSRISDAVTMSARFCVNEFLPANGTSVFSNTEWGGYSLEVNHKTHQLEFWCLVGGHYIIVSAPIEAGKYVTAYGVYDGKSLILYLDGKEVARKSSLKGPISYTRNSRARAFCVGADINAIGGGENLFPGTVAFARLYSWALTSDQVKNLSETTTNN